MGDAGALVYVVDDDSSAREGVARLIRSAGLSTKTFASGEEFLAAPRPKVPSCLVLDVNLPGVSGFDLQLELGKSGPQLPIIFITGDGDIPMAVRALKAGAANFLTKPFDDENLLNAVRQSISCYLDDEIRCEPSVGKMVGESIADGSTLSKASFHTQFRLTGQGQACLEHDIRLEERSRERARILHELHDTLFQGFLGASMLLHQAVEQTAADSPSKPALSTALHLVSRAIDEGRAAVRGLHTPAPAPASIEQAFSNLLDEVTPARGVRPQVFVQGKTRALHQVIQEQLFLIGREALMNALRHSEATKIEIEVQYLSSLVGLSVRDNGRGINPEGVQKLKSSHWGLRGMRERAERIGARFGICSRPGEGTEVRVAVPV
ncbi:MAG: response regulator [Acidobacteriaceae bacterium]|nr:response regulator [Acidobacteriaceae bacterium]